MKNQALLLVAEDDPDDQYFFQEVMEVVCPQNVEIHIVLDGTQLMKSVMKDPRRLPEQVGGSGLEHARQGRTYNAPRNQSKP